jgi:hypothetical protein
VTPAGGTSPDALNLDPTFNQFQVVGEIEERTSFGVSPARSRSQCFLSHGRAALFSDANALAQATGTPADTALVRNNFTNRSKVTIHDDHYGGRYAPFCDGSFSARPTLTVFGWAGTALMAITVIALFWSSLG